MRHMPPGLTHRNRTRRHHPRRSVSAPSLFSKKGLYAALMERAMRDELFKTQLFRFVDVLPTLNSPSEIARHLGVAGMGQGRTGFV